MGFCEDERLFDGCAFAAGRWPTAEARLTLLSSWVVGRRTGEDRLAENFRGFLKVLSTDGATKCSQTA
jgi:hypothetical protein